MDPLRRNIALRALVLPAFAALLCLALPAGPADAKKKRASASAAARIVSLARKELAHGVHEIPDGSNKAPAIYRYDQATAPHWYGAPWCAYFVSYIAKRAGVPIGPGGKGLGYVPYIRSWAKQTGRWTRKPRAGALITFPQHVGIVEAVYSNHTLTTIEGNSGNAVRRVYRRWSEAMGYVKVANGSVPTKPAPAPRKKPRPKAPAQPLVARITAYPSSKIAVGQTVDFTSNDSSGDIAKADWDLDGNGHYDAHGDNVQRRYDKAGAYTAKLRITDRRGRTANATITITVKSNKPPVAVLDVPMQVEVGKSIRASATRSYDPDGKIVGWYWDLNGDGDYGADGSSRYFTYDQPGDYYAGLRVKDNDGNVAEVHLPVHVYDHPDPVTKLSCSAKSIPSGAPLSCHADDSASPTKIVKHEWDMNDDASYGTGGNDASYTYSSSGWYAVHLRVTDSNGRRSEVTTDIQVTNRAPNARITVPSKVVLGQSATFAGTGSSDPDGVLYQWEWDLDGDGRYDAIGSTTSTMFNSFGARTIGLRVTDDLGATGIATATVNVLAPPVSAPRVVTATPVAGSATTLDPGASFDPDGYGLTKFRWDYDSNGTWDKTVYSATAVTKTYATAGTYTARLEVTDGDGLVSAATVPVTVR